MCFSSTSLTIDKKSSIYTIKRSHQNVFAVLVISFGVACSRRNYSVVDKGGVVVIFFSSRNLVYFIVEFPGFFALRFFFVFIHWSHSQYYFYFFHFCYIILYYFKLYLFIGKILNSLINNKKWTT